LGFAVVTSETYFSKYSYKNRQCKPPPREEEKGGENPHRPKNTEAIIFRMLHTQ
jgi:hypothetical protein